MAASRGISEPQPPPRRVTALPADASTKCATGSRERRSQFGEELLARLCWRNAAGRAREESNPDLFFEPSNRVTEGRLGHSEPFRGLREAPLVRNRQEGRDYAEFILAPFVSTPHRQLPIQRPF